PGGWVVRSVYPETVPLTGTHPGDVDVPHEPIDLGDLHVLGVAGVVDEAQLDALGDAGVHREVGAATGEGGTEGIGVAWPCVHGDSLPPISPAGGEAAGRSPHSRAVTVMEW